MVNFRGYFSPPIICILRIELRSSGLEVRSLTYQPSHQPKLCNLSNSSTEKHKGTRFMANIVQSPCKYAELSLRSGPAVKRKAM